MSAADRLRVPSGQDTAYWDQAGFAARFEWGEEGVRRLAPLSDVVVIVDVLRFTTCVDIAVGRGARVFPYRWRDASAEAFAAERNAHLALPRGQTTPEQPYSLSPTSLEGLEAGARIVLPSPNGSTLTTIAAESGATVLAGCLRNATAVGQAAAQRGQVVTVVAAGERWPDNSLRPAIEDLIGAGAILTAMRPTAPSPEAIAAIAAYAAVAGALPEFIGACSSGRELVQIGLAGDVLAATQHDSSAAVPVLTDGAFVNAAG